MRGRELNDYEKPYHEAGHAVVAWRQRLRFRYVTIKPDEQDGSLGHVMHVLPNWFRSDEEWSDRTVQLVERHIVNSFTGQIPQTRFRGRRPRYGMHSDNQSAPEMAIQRHQSKEIADAYLRYCFVLASGFVSANWRLIESVAEALVQRGTLSYSDVVEVIWPGTTEVRRRLAASAKARKHREQEGG